MEQQQASTPVTPNPNSQSSEPPPPQPHPSSTIPSTPTSSPATQLPPNHNHISNSFNNQNPNFRPSTFSNQSPLLNQSVANSPQTPRPPTALTRTWQPSNFSHFSSSSSSASPVPPATLSSPSPSSISAPPSYPHRGSIATGVPVHHPNPHPQPAPFSPSYAQHFGGLGRGGVNVSEQASQSIPSQASVRPHMQGMQGVGTMGAIGSSSQIRTGAIPAHQLQRPVQSSFRPQSSPSNQPSTSQSFQSHSLLRVPSVGSPGSLSPSMSQGMQSPNQPWLSSSSQGKPPLPTPSYRQQMNPPSLLQRSHAPQLQQNPLPSASQQQPNPLPSASQQQHMSSSQQLQSSQSHQVQEQFGQQFQPPRAPQALSHQPQGTRAQAAGTQKPSSLAISQSMMSSSVTLNRQVASEADDSCTRVLSKRTINELVNQIDPSETLDPEVEDILVDLADEFVDSITTFGCSLAKHRKSTTLEAKDILLHLERNWNMTLPGFVGDEIKIFKKPLSSDIHKERLAAIKKSAATSEMTHNRSSAGQAAGNTKGGLTKTPANVIGSKP